MEEGSEAEHGCSANFTVEGTEFDHLSQFGEFILFHLLFSEEMHL